MAAVKKEPGFEEGMLRLDKLAGEMEQGDLSLEELLSLYEEGMALAASLEKKLGAAQKRMQEIRLSADGKAEAAPAEIAEQVSLLQEQ